MALNNYELPDSTMQLIAASDFGNAFKSFNQDVTPGQSAGALKPDNLIKALRDATKAGPSNPGVNLLANRANGKALKTRDYKDQIFHPQILRMAPGVKADVVLPGAETKLPYVPPYVPPFVPPIVDDEIVVDDVIKKLGDDVVGDDDDVDLGVEGTFVRDTVVGGTGNDTVDGGTSTVIGGTGNDTIVGGTSTVVGGTGNDTVVMGTGGTGTGLTGTGVIGTGAGGTGTSTVVGGTGSDTVVGGTGVAGTGGTTLRDTIVAAVNGSGGSIDNSAAGLSGSALSALGSSLTADQLAALTTPKVPNVTLEVTGNGLSLDDKNSTTQRFDYPELLSPEELKAYESWMLQQKGGTSSGGGGGKPDDYWFDYEAV